MKIWLTGYGAALVAIGLLDALWLGFIARDFYRGEIGELMVDPIRWVPAAVFYFGFPAGLLALALTPKPASLGSATLRSAGLGLLAYGVYDMSNLATLQAWTLKLALVDMAWGTVLAASAGVAAFSAMRWMAAR